MAVTRVGTEEFSVYDAIVVGARCAGSATALLLARSGWRVLLLDRARFPSDTMSTSYIHQPGVQRLAQWDLLNEVIASGCPRLDRISYVVEGVRLTGSAPRLGEVDSAYAPSRYVLDKILVDATVRAGVDFRDGGRVVGLVVEHDRVVGVRVRRTGAVETYNAPLVVGADGMRSSVARWCGADVVVRDPVLSCVYYSTWRDLPAHFECYERTGGWVAVIPTHDQITMVATYLPQQRFAEIRRDALAVHLAQIDATAPELRERLRAGVRVGRVVGHGDQQNFFRQAYGPGWALVGDAAHHKDSITARGITDAFLQAELLAMAVGPDPRDEAVVRAGLERYSAQRDAMLADAYQGALSLARLRVSEDRLTLLRAVSDSAESTQRYLGLMAGMSTIDDVLTPELLDACEAR